MHLCSFKPRSVREFFTAAIGNKTPSTKRRMHSLLPSADRVRSVTFMVYLFVGLCVIRDPHQHGGSTRAGSVPVTAPPPAAPSAGLWLCTVVGRVALPVLCLTLLGKCTLETLLQQDHRMRFPLPTETERGPSPLPNTGADDKCAS